MSDPFFAFPTVTEHFRASMIGGHRNHIRDIIRARRVSNERLEAVRQENLRADVAKLCQYANILTNVVQSTFKSDPTACKLLKHLIVAHKIADDDTSLADVIKKARQVAVDHLFHHVSSAVEHYQWVYELCGVLLDNLNSNEAPQLP